jgi:hypothetical protein
MKKLYMIIYIVNLNKDNYDFNAQHKTNYASFSSRIIVLISKEATLKMFCYNTN